MKDFKIEKPPIGVEVIFFNPEWIDTDYNPKGMRVGFLNESEDGPVVTAKFNNHHDYYETDESFPTHWQHFPEMPTQNGK